MKNYFILVLIFGLICSTIGCGPAEQESAKPVIVTTTGIIADCIRNIVGDKAEVLSIMGAGVDPHLYKASQGDLEKLSKADVIIYNGLHLEGKMAQVLSKMSANKLAIAVGDYADPDELKRADAQSDLYDPHIWFNPELWMNSMQGVCFELEKVEGIGSLDSSFAAYYSKVMTSQKKLLLELDSLLADSQRILITSHDAFEYFGDAFRFKVRGLQGISTAAEYGIKDVSNLISFVVDNKVKAVFIETSVSDKNLRSVVEGAKARNYELKIGGTLYSDALGADGTKEGTYIGMIEANVRTIIQGLK